MRLRIAHKLFIGFGVLLAGIGVMAWKSQATASTAGSAVDKLKASPALVASAGDLEIALVRARLAMTEFLATNDEAVLARVDEAFKAASDEADRALAQRPSETIHQRVESIQVESSRVAGASRDVIESVRRRNEAFERVVAAAERVKSSAVGLDGPIAQLATRAAGLALQANTRGSVAADRAQAARAVEELVSTLRAASGPPPEFRDQTSQLASAFADFNAAAADRDRINREVIAPADERLTEAFTELSTLVSDEATTLANEARTSLDSAASLALISSIIALSLGLAAAVFIGRGVQKGVSSLLRQVEALRTTRNLTQKVVVGTRDELDDVAHGINDLIATIRELVSEVGAASRSTAAAATEIAASAEEMAAGISRQEQQTTQVAAAVQEMAASVTEVATKSNDAATAAKASHADSTSGGEVVSQTVGEIQQIASDVSKSASAVASLGKKSEQIGQIIEVINDIADQTNLLALNAAIEAARAGEHGRGFAVVADEVRRLAERTTKATEEVAHSIREIQGETSTAVQLIESGSTRVARGVELANAAGQSLGRITQSSEGLASMVAAIAAAAEQQSAASEEISRSVEQICAVSRESSEGASQAAQAASTLSQQAEKLQQLISRFTV